jgi:predicted ribosomally synthesized peptide with nif11-like leader
MKTIEEFIQRLQNDATFEKEAQAFDHGDDLMAFVKRQGYDFTLEQLMSEFEPGEKAPADVSLSPPSGPGEAGFPMKPEAFANGETGTALLKGGNDGFTREHPVERLQQPKGAKPPPGPEEEPSAGLLRGGGGRHRGFSPQRLKSISEEDP